MTTDSSSDPESVPPRRPYRRVAALVVLVAGIAWVAATASKAQKQAVAIHMTLPDGARGLRLDIRSRAAPSATPPGKVIEHLEWSYAVPPPTAQDAALELLPGDYAVIVHLVGAGRDPEPIALQVAQGEAARLNVDLRGR